MGNTPGRGEGNNNSSRNPLTRIRGGGGGYGVTSPNKTFTEAVGGGGGAAGFGQRTMQQEVVNLQSFVPNNPSGINNLGEGAFGSVVVMRKKDNGKYFAMKTLSKRVVLEKKQEENVLNELKILSSMDHHPFIVNLWYAFQDDENLYEVIDVMLGGSLAMALTKSAEDPAHSRPSSRNPSQRVGYFVESRARFYAAELVLGIQFLHENRVVHRDIKPDNVLIDAEGHVRITDFNVSMILPEGDPRLDQPHKEGWGTRGYRAPEIYLREGAGFLFACDWWSLGATLYEMLVGEVPYPVKPDAEPVEMLKKVFANDFNRDLLPNDDAKSICERLLSFAPNERIGCQDGPNSEVEIMTHDFFSNYQIDWDALEKRTVQAPWVPSNDQSRPSYNTPGKPNHRGGGEDDSMSKYRNNFEQKSSAPTSTLKRKNPADSLPLTPAVQNRFRKWGYNAEFRMEMSKKPEFSLLQLVCSQTPDELRRFVIQANGETLATLCSEIKHFREQAMEDNLKLLSTEIRNDELHQKNLELKLENKKLRNSSTGSSGLASLMLNAARANKAQKLNGELSKYSSSLQSDGDDDSSVENNSNLNEVIFELQQEQQQQEKKPETSTKLPRKVQGSLRGSVLGIVRNDETEVDDVDNSIDDEIAEEAKKIPVIEIPKPKPVPIPPKRNIVPSLLENKNENGPVSNENPFDNPFAEGAEFDFSQSENLNSRLNDAEVEDFQSFYENASKFGKPSAIVEEENARLRLEEENRRIREQEQAILEADRRRIASLFPSSTPAVVDENKNSTIIQEQTQKISALEFALHEKEISLVNLKSSLEAQLLAKEQKLKEAETSLANARAAAAMATVTTSTVAAVASSKGNDLDSTSKAAINNLKQELANKDRELQAKIALVSASTSSLASKDAELSQLKDALKKADSANALQLKALRDQVSEKEAALIAQVTLANNANESLKKTEQELDLIRKEITLMKTNQSKLEQEKVALLALYTAEKQKIEIELRNKEKLYEEQTIYIQTMKQDIEQKQNEISQLREQLGSGNNWDNVRTMLDEKDALLQKLQAEKEASSLESKRLLDEKENELVRIMEAQSKIIEQKSEELENSTADLAKYKEELAKIQGLLAQKTSQVNGLEAMVLASSLKSGREEENESMDKDQLVSELEQKDHLISQLQDHMREEITELTEKHELDIRVREEKIVSLTSQIKELEKAVESLSKMQNLDTLREIEHENQDLIVAEIKKVREEEGRRRLIASESSNENINRLTSSNDDEAVDQAELERVRAEQLAYIKAQKEKALASNAEKERLENEKKALTEKQRLAAEKEKNERERIAALAAQQDLERKKAAAAALAQEEFKKKEELGTMSKAARIAEEQERKRKIAEQKLMEEKKISSSLRNIQSQQEKRDDDDSDRNEIANDANAISSSSTEDENQKKLMEWLEQEKKNAEENSKKRAEAEKLKLSKRKPTSQLVEMSTKTTDSGTQQQHQQESSPRASLTDKRSAAASSSARDEDSQLENEDDNEDLEGSRITVDSDANTASSDAEKKKKRRVPRVKNIVRLFTGKR